MEESCDRVKLFDDRIKCETLGKMCRALPIVHRALYDRPVKQPFSLEKIHAE